MALILRMMKRQRNLFSLRYSKTKVFKLVYSDDGDDGDNDDDEGMDDD